MVNANKVKGTRWESAVRDFFLSGGNDAHRVAQAGEDMGDVFLNSHFSVQCKDVAASNYSKWVTDAKAQAKAAGRLFGVVIHKRRQRSVGDSYVVMDLDTFDSLALRLKVLEMLVRERKEPSSAPSPTAKHQDWCYDDTCVRSIN